MGVVITEDMHRRTASAVRWVEANRRGAPSLPTPPRGSAAEAIWCRVTSATVDGNGRYPAVVTIYDAVADTWSDYSAVKLEAPNGETLVDETRYLARPAGLDGSDEVYVATAPVASGASLTVKEVDGSPSVSSVTEIRCDQATGLSVVSVSSGVCEIELRSASASQMGAVDTSSQAFAGAKTFNDLLVAASGLHVYNGTSGLGTGDYGSFGGGAIVSSRTYAQVTSQGSSSRSTSIYLYTRTADSVTAGSIEIGTDNGHRPDIKIPTGSGTGTGQTGTYAGMVFTSGLLTSGSFSGLSWSSVPGSAGATGTAGQVAYDSDYLYVCTATNTWMRIAKDAWA